MNFLAHLYLTETDPASMVGGLLPDLVRGPVPRGLAPAVLASVANHRRVDAFTDTHPLFNRSRLRLRPTEGRFAGILVDVFYDHFLSLDWAGHHRLPLDRFIDLAHARLDAGRPLMPEPMRPVIERMIEQRWLGCYLTPDGLRLTLARMSRRLSDRTGRAIDLVPAVDALMNQHDELHADFRAFFPDLVRHLGRTPHHLDLNRSVA